MELFNVLPLLGYCTLNVASQVDVVGVDAREAFPNWHAHPAVEIGQNIRSLN